MINNDDKKILVLDSPGHWTAVIALLVKWTTLTDVYVMEPYSGYHCKKKNGVRFFSDQWPVFVHWCVEKDFFQSFKLESDLLRKIHLDASRLAVNNVNQYIPIAQARFHDALKMVENITLSSESKNILSMRLVDELAVFYSQQKTLQSLDKHFSSDRFQYYSGQIAETYFVFEKWQQQIDPSAVNFLKMYSKGLFVRSFIINQILAFKLFCRAVCRLLLCVSTIFGKKIKKGNFQYGFIINSPERQLANNNRQAGFLLSGVNVSSEDICYFVVGPTTKNQVNALGQISKHYYFVKPLLGCVGRFQEWLQYFSLLLKYWSLPGFISSFERFMDSYFRWKFITQHVSIKHLITHSDFGDMHLGRNIALNHAETETWYFTDSMNLSCNFQKDVSDETYYHPFWCYLYYDHFVTWNDFIANYYRRHPGSLKNIHSLGCLWHTEQSNRKSEFLKKYFNVNEGMFLAVYDTTYSLNGFTSYDEGIAFAKHIYELVQKQTDVYLILKPKKPLSYSSIDGSQGQELLEWYEKMDSHPRMKLLNYEQDVNEINSSADMIISFPFTSTTYEGFASHKNAIWYDPLNKYEETVYASKGLVVHGKDKLQECIAAVREGRGMAIDIEELVKHGLVDSHQDGKAVERFRTLLMKASTASQQKILSGDLVKKS